MPLANHLETRGEINEKNISIRVSGFKDYCPIDYGRTWTRLAHREIDNMIAYGRIYKMKKLLVIVVLGLLYCTSSFGETFEINQIVE